MLYYWSSPSGHGHLHSSQCASLATYLAPISSASPWGYYEWQHQKLYWSPGRFMTLPSVTRPDNLLQKVIRLVKHDNPFMKPSWLHFMIFLSFMCLEMISRKVRKPKTFGWHSRTTSFKLKIGESLSVRNQAKVAGDPHGWVRRS